MATTGSLDSVTGLSTEKIIELIRDVRNDLIKDFQKDEVLSDYFQEKFQKPLSNIKREFIKRDLKELQLSSLDLNHYAGLIIHIKETGTVFLAERNVDYFYEELKVIFQKY